MTCESVRALLPLFIYDDLGPDEVQTVTRHLADCPACQVEHAAWAQTRTALDAAPTPSVAIDALALLRADSRRQATRLGHWRRAAIAVGALAAALLLVLALRVEVRAGNGQFTVAWGTPAPILNPAPPTQIAQPEFQERLLLVQQIARALAADVADRDDRQQAALVRLRAEVEGLQRFSVERWRETERDVAALYRTAFHRPVSGEKQ